MNWLDWLIIVVMAWSALQGLWSGLLASLFGLTGIIAGLAISSMYYQSLAGYLIAAWHLEEKVLPFLGTLFSGRQGPSRELNYVYDYLAGSIAEGIIEVVSFLGLFIFTFFLFRLAGFVLTRIAALAFLGPLNKLAGLMFGLVKGFLIIVIVLALLAPFQQQNLLPDYQSAPPGLTSYLGTAFQTSLLLPYFEPYINMLGRLLPEILRDKGLPGSMISI
ncbi:MAG: colicin V production protein [Pelotomaculum sp. PtaB.Bin104]|nr:MAG: colicin V production protein [Pelotomaculum sp. PtaB.Bin104]